MTTLREAAQQALEALENCSSEYGHRCNRCDSEVDEGGKVASALRAALAQQAEPEGSVCARCGALAFDPLVPQQAEPVEPVAWQCREHGDSEWFDCGKESYGINPRRYTYRTLYTAPPQRLPLTEEEIDKIFKHLCSTVGASYKTMARAVERAHGIKE